MSTLPTITRYRFGERLVHAVAGLSYLYLLLTGLAFWTPALYWLAVVLGGGYLSRVLHPWLGLVFAGAVLWMFLTWWRDMRTTDADRAWRRALRHYAQNEDVLVPGAGRFNYGQKMLFWLMVWGAVALAASGRVMWYVALAPPVVRTIATFVHAAAALATIGGFIVHVYMGIAVVPGGLNAIVGGDVSEEWASRHHPLWLHDLRSRDAGRGSLR